MGNSHFKSNVKAKAGTETITGFASITASSLGSSGNITGANVTVSGNVDAGAGRVAAGTYIQIGTGQYILFGSRTKVASIAQDASSLVGSPCKGSLYLSKTAGAAYIFTSNKAATKLTTA